MNRIPQNVICRLLALGFACVLPACSTPQITKQSNYSDSFVSTVSLPISTSSSSSTVSIVPFSPETKGGFLFTQQHSVTDDNPPYCSLIQLTLQRISPDGSRQAVAVLHGGESNVQYSDGIAYFITEKGELAQHELVNNKTTILPVPDIIPQQKIDISCFLVDSNHGVRDFLVKGSVIFYLQGSCGTGMDITTEMCKVYSFDLQLQERNLVADVQQLILPRTGIAFSPKSSSEDIVYLQSIFVDAGHGAGTLYSLDTQSGKSQVAGKASSEYCEGTCSLEQTKQNAQFDELFPESLTHACGNWKPIDEQYSMKYMAADTEETVEQARFVACLE